MNKVLKTALLVLFLHSVTDMHLYAQQNHFIYIQSDDKVPFEVSVNGVTYNSSSIGYVIVPKLTKGNHQLNIAFQNKKYPDQQFNCLVDKADVGFLLKNYEDKGWGLFNLQSLEIIMAVGVVLPEAQVQKAVDNSNAFGDMLSEVVNDSSLNAKTEPIKPKQKEILVSADTSAVVKNEIIGEQKVSVGTENEKTGVNSVIAIPAAGVPIVSGDIIKTGLLKIRESSTTDGTDIVFVDKNSGLNDTIRIFLPAQRATAQEQQEEVEIAKKIVDESVKAADSIVLPSKEIMVKKEDVVIADSDNKEVKNPFFTNQDQKSAPPKDIANSSTVIDNEKELETVKEQSAGLRLDCKNMLSEGDMDKLRKKMVNAGSDEKMIAVIGKNMKDKCLSTEQVRSLGALFLSDDGRYNFFNSVYSSVYDVAIFSSLENQLIDPDYKKRFKALLK